MPPRKAAFSTAAKRGTDLNHVVVVDANDVPGLELVVYQGEGKGILVSAASKRASLAAIGASYPENFPRSILREEIIGRFSARVGG